MLERLIIRNIALIEHLDFELGAGLNVLTGETGAGKSIIVDSVNLILGERANRELISSGSQKARVEAFFNINGQDGVKKQLDALGIEYEDDTLVVMREITASGKSTCRLNGEIVPLATLKTVTDTLVDVHGQHEHQSLLSQKKHIGMLDNYAGLPVAEFKEKTENLYRRHSEVVHKLNSGFLSEAERERRIDILSYQINEIDAAALTVGEEATIQEELNMLSNAEKINSALENSGENISGDGGALEKLGSAVNSLAQIAEISSKYGELYELLNNTYYELEDGAYQLRELRLGYEYSPERAVVLDVNFIIFALLIFHRGSIYCFIFSLINQYGGIFSLPPLHKIYNSICQDRDCCIPVNSLACVIIVNVASKVFFNGVINSSLPFL